MKEVTGNLWDYTQWPSEQFFRCITTNGTVKKDRTVVMGRGCAFEAKKAHPGIEATLGKMVTKAGNIVHYLGHAIYSFPVKHNWHEKADLDLIKQSAQQLKQIADANPTLHFILPRPGCGNGQRQWEDVKPVIEFLPDNVLVITK